MGQVPAVGGLTGCHRPRGVSPDAAGGRPAHRSADARAEEEPGVRCAGPGQPRVRVLHGDGRGRDDRPEHHQHPERCEGTAQRVCRRLLLDALHRPSGRVHRGRADGGPRGHPLCGGHPHLQLGVGLDHRETGAAALHVRHDCDRHGALSVHELGRRHRRGHPLGERLLRLEGGLAAGSHAPAERRRQDVQGGGLPLLRQRR
mmetsp:Transcript_30628/g.84471  ORF Transcript_30628/g.84471 Transcript_30628/m.84471 type:complete len:202 (-) Transcript_30628:920-1525(-)